VYMPCICLCLVCVCVICVCASCVCLPRVCVSCVCESGIFKACVLSHASCPRELCQTFCALTDCVCLVLFDQVRGRFSLYSRK